MHDLLNAEFTFVDDSGIREYSISQEERDNAVKWASVWADVYRSDDLHLLLDFDVPFATDYAKRHIYGNQDVWQYIEDYVGIEDREYWSSKSGNTHCYVTLKQPVAAAERIALQSCLGSDPKREALSVLRLLNSIEEPSLLFKPKAKP
jgi:hypothetical protein